MSPKRIDAADTVDTATHFLHRLQADGWVLDTLEHTVEYYESGEKGPKLPMRACITIQLVPVRG